MLPPLTRRTLLASSAAAGAGMLLPSVGHAATAKAAGPYWDRILIMIELDGGNDGLNTVVPYAVPDYSERRPTLRYSATQLAGTLLGTGAYQTNRGGVSLTQSFALNPGMPHLMPAWAASDMAVVLGLGYTNPNLSHFRSMDIWNGGGTSAQFPPDNWLGRILSQNNIAAQTQLAAHGVLLSRYSSNPLQKSGINYLAMSKPKDFIDRSYYLEDTAGKTSTSSQFEHALRVQEAVIKARGSFRSSLTVQNTSPDTKPSHFTYTPPTFTSAVAFNLNSAFETRCKSIAEMICTEKNVDPDKRLKIPVYKVQIGGFDNHDTQKAKHEDLLAQVASGIANMRKAFIEKGLWDKVLIMTYSEFGRRVEENGSQGTDHGTVNCHLMVGGKVAGGIYGTQPGLSKTYGDLDSRGNMINTTDFRSYYATAAAWLGLSLASDAGYLSGQSAIGLFDP